MTSEKDPPRDFRGDLDPLVLRDDSGTAVIGSLRDRGRDSGVVIVHGILCSRSMPEIRRLSEALGAEHDVLAIDVRGHGDGPGRFSWGREEWRQVRAAVEHLAGGKRSVAALGFSFGGYHAAVAASRGTPVDRLVLASAPVDLAVHDHFLFGPTLWRHLPAMLRRRRGWPRLEMPRALGRRALSDDDLRRIEARTLVIHAGRDWLVSRRHALRYASRIRGATLLEVPGGLHAEYLMRSSPEAFLDAVLGFLRK